MTVLIKGMKKPTACYKCKLRTGKYCGILTENEKCADDGVLPHCPIVEILIPHGRLIDADKLHEQIESREYNDTFNEYEHALTDAYILAVYDVEDAPTVIEAEGEE